MCLTGRQHIRVGEKKIGMGAALPQNTPRVVSALFCPSDCNGGCCSQLPRKVNYSIDTVSSHYRRSWCRQTARQGMPEASRYHPSQRITDLEAATCQMRQLSCILDSCTISASYEVSQPQKAVCHAQPKVQARHLKSWCTDFTHCSFCGSTSFYS